MITQHEKINLKDISSPRLVPCVQGDTGRSIVFDLADFTPPEGATATYYVQKPSGLAVYNTATIDGNSVLVDLTAESIAEVGDNYLQIRILDDEEVVTSFDCILAVAPFRGIDAIESGSESNIFDQAAAQALIDFEADAQEKAAETIATIPDDYTALSNSVTDLKNALNIINPTADITWELGKSINGSGDVITNNYTALSNDIQCEPGDFFVTTSPTVDANNKFLVYYIVQYNGDTFISRTEFTSSIRSIVIGDTTTKIRVVFGRYGSSQTTITQQDITTYVAIKFARKAASKVDTNLQFRNTVLNKYTDIGTGINNITENSFVFSPEGTANNPTTTGGYFIQTILYNTSGTAAMQIAYKYDVGLCYYRRKVNGSWRSWILNSAPANPTSPLYYAFGDSLTYGAVWTPKEESPYYQITQASLINQIPTRIANAIGASNSFANKGVGGAYFVGTGTNKIITAIQNQDLSNAKIITIAGGRNDSENTLGDKTATSGDGTICGAIREILDYVTTNYKKLQIVWIGVTPNTSNNATVFTRVFAGGWSLNSFDEKVSELCAEYSVPYVNWKMCTYMRHWADYSGAAEVYSHPNNEESYLQMGNYIAGQVAQYYRG